MSFIPGSVFTLKHDKVSLLASEHGLVAFVDTDSSIKFQGQNSGWSVFTIVPLVDQIHQ
eukprot:Awhi_evm1s5586